MRFAVALVTLLVAAGLLVAGIAQRTFLRPADHVTMSAETPTGSRFVVVPGSVLRAHPGQQRVHLEGAGTVFAAYGRAADVRAWLAGERYSEIGTDADGAVRSVVRTAPRITGATSADVTDPDGSDLWIDQRRGTRQLDWPLSVPSSVSLLIASDGTAAAPADVRISWPVRGGTPLALPMIAAGGALAVLGLVLYAWALVHVRRRRGPRRKAPPKMPRAPQPPRYRPAKPVATGPGRGRRSTSRSSVHGWVPAVLVLATAAAGGAVVAPSDTAAAKAAPTAAVTEQQARRIVLDAASVAARADREGDRELLATRFAGPALQLRTAAYAVRKKDRKAKAPQAIPQRDAEFNLILPQATDAWPRTLFAVLKEKGSTLPPTALTLVQDAPRAAYTVRYAMALVPRAEVPDLPNAILGASRIDAEAPVLRVAPAKLAEDYGRLLKDGDDEVADEFATTSDELVKGVGEKAKAKVAKRLGSTAAITFKDLDVDPDQVVAMSTADSGALVSVPLSEQWTVKPRRSGVNVKPSGGTRILAKTSSTDEGIASVYGYQLLFSVPSAGSDEPVTLLGYAQGLVSAKEL